MPTKPALKPGTTTTVAPDALNFYHRNARRGDIPAIARSLKRLNQYKPLTGNIGTHTGRPNEVLAGNHTLAAIRVLRDDDPADPRWREAKVHWVDVDDVTAREINLADNRTAELGGYDTAELVALIKDVPAVDLSAIGYSPDDLTDLLTALEEYEGLPDGMQSGRDLTDNGSDYAERLTTRMMILVWPIQQFVWAQNMMEKLRAHTGAETNADAVLHLLAEWAGEPAPEAPGED